MLVALLHSALNSKCTTLKVGLIFLLQNRNYKLKLKVVCECSISDLGPGLALEGCELGLGRVFRLSLYNWAVAWLIVA